jgi:hypothetical protein
MSIEFRCTGCGKLLRTGDNTAGRQAKCPQCGALVTIPAAPAGQLTSPPPPAFPPAADETLNPFQSPRASTMSAADTPPYGPLQPVTLDVADVLGRSWEIFKGNLGMCYAVVLVAWLTPVGVNLAISAFATAASRATGVVAVGSLIRMGAFIPVQLLSLYLYMGMIRMLLKMARGKAPDFTELFAFRPQFWPFVGVVILLGLAYFVAGMLLGVPAFIAVMVASHVATEAAIAQAVLFAIGFAFLAGSIPAAGVALFFAQAPYLVLDRQVPVFESFGVSKDLMLGNKGTLLLIWLLEIGLAVIAILPGCAALLAMPFSLNNLIVGILLACIGLFVVVPCIRLIDVVVYLTLVGNKPAATPADDQPGNPPAWTQSSPFTPVDPR